MSFTAFRYFNEIAKVKSIRRAADRLHVAPSAVSRQLSQLEHTLGTQLVERTNTGVQLTTAGLILERYTRTMFRDLERVQNTIKEFQGLRQGEVSVWVIEGLISGFLPAVIAAFNERYPAIHFNVFSDSTDRITEALIRNEADIGILFNGQERAEIEIIAQHIEPVMCLMAPSDEFADRTSLTLADLCSRPMALPVASFGLRQVFEHAIARKKLTANVVVTANTIELTKALAATGRTLSIAPALGAMRELRDGTLRAVPIDDPAFRRASSTLCIHRDRSLSYAAREVLKALTQAFDGLGKPA